MKADTDYVKVASAPRENATSALGEWRFHNSFNRKKAVKYIELFCGGFG